MNRLTVIVVSVAMLGMGILAPAVMAQPTADEILRQNVSVAYEPPQASAEALLQLPSVYVVPGSWLYWFKHLFEDVRMIFVSKPADRTELLLEFSRERLAEGYQALQHNDWPAAKEAFSEYQRTHEQISASLESMQQENADVAGLLDELRLQLGIQQALDDLVSHKAPGDEAKTISAYLRIRPRQTLALARAESGALLGARDRKEASPSAQASQSASPSAQPARVTR